MGATSASVPTSVQPTYQSASAPSIVAGQFHSVLVTTAGARESALVLTCFCFSVARDRNKNMMSLLLRSYIFHGWIVYQQNGLLPNIPAENESF